MTFDQLQKRKNIKEIGYFGELSDKNINNIQKKVEIVGDCWIWSGSMKKLKSGSFIGKFKFNSHPVNIKHLIYHNYINDYKQSEIQINNICFESKCIRPSHLMCINLKNEINNKIKEVNNILSQKKIKFTDDFLQFLIGLKRIKIPTIGKLGEMSNEYIEKIIHLIDFNKEQIKLDCWIWKGRERTNQRKGHKHGVRKFKGKDVYIHRLIYHNFIEDLSEYNISTLENQINHTCQSDGKCINPWHLYLGSGYSNILNSIEDKTSIILNPQKGSNHYKSKISNEQVKEIRKLREEENKKYKDIAKKFKIHPSYVSEICLKKVRK